MPAPFRGSGGTLAEQPGQVVAGLPARWAVAGQLQVLQQPPVPQPYFVAGLIIIGSIWKRSLEWQTGARNYGNNRMA